MDDSPEMKERISAFFDNVIEVIETHGWYAQSVFYPNYDPGPSFIYTVGFALKLNHPEFITFSMPNEFAHQIFDSLYQKIMDGATYRHGDVLPLSEFAVGNPVVSFILVEVENSREHLTMSNNFYLPDSPVPALQICWPDEEDRFPWDDGFTDHELQPLLGRAP